MLTYFALVSSYLAVSDVSQCITDGKLSPCGPGNQVRSMPLKVSFLSSPVFTTHFSLFLSSHSLPPPPTLSKVCPPGPFGKNTPQFHVKDASCGENDPNGPSYDPVHGVYHLHYQNHVGLHGGRTYGHAVSKDMTKWAHMPDSIWNDQPYDASAIYTGSATVVNGTVVQVYPG